MTGLWFLKAVVIILGVEIIVMVAIIIFTMLGDLRKDRRRYVTQMRLDEGPRLKRSNFS